MPASSSETRNRWRKRKREPQISRRQKPQNEEEDDDEEDDDELEQQQHDFDDDLQPQPNPNSSDPAPLHEVLSDGGVRISEFPRVVKHTVNRPHSSVLAIVGLERAIQCGGESRNHQPQNVVVLENISYGQLQATSAVPADSPALGDPERGDGSSSSSSSYVIAPPTIMEGRGVVKRFGSDRVHVVPMHADWFSPNTVHRLERQVVPNFFCGKSADHTPEKYMECRNLIVVKYIEKPERRVSVPDCQGLVVGVDIDDLTRIVRFLDHWGIINYSASSPNGETLNDGSYLSEDSNGEVVVPSAALKSIDSLIQFDKPKCRLKPADVCPSLSCLSDDTSDLDSRIRDRLSENRCNYCSRPVPTMYYQSQKEVDILLCLDCFHEGRFVTGHSSLDFIRVNSTKDYGDMDGESWTDQETLLLLEAMEIYSDNWNEIAEHVGTKSKAQCILQFIRLPMEDGSLDNVEVPSSSISSNLANKYNSGRSHSTSNGDSAGSCLEDPDSEARLPFAKSGNPVMALVAFLASAVGPRVAAACAHASLAALSEDSGFTASGSVTKEGPGHGHTEGSSHGGDITNSSQQKEESSAIQGSYNQNDVEVASLSDEKVRAAVKAGLSAAATKAKLFADHEEREIQRLSANIINHQLKRLELKLRQFAEVETLLMKECEQVERARQRIGAERTRMVSGLSAQFGPTGVTSSVSLPGVSPTMVNSTSNNNRQHVMSGSLSQPLISGYGNNQPNHPSMSFMPRQQLYGLGPRLPLSDIHPSSSATPNVMSNSSANAQAALNHPMLRPGSGLG